MSIAGRTIGRWAVLVAALASSQGTRSAEPLAGPAAAQTFSRIDLDRGICAVLGLPGAAGPAQLVDLVQRSALVVYFQSSRVDEVAAVREAAIAVGLLGTRVFADEGPCRAIHLADNLADALIVAATAEKEFDDAEILRVLHPDAVALVGNRRLVKPHAVGVDQWSHVFHAPDNNPQSTDQLARAPYLTQFLADPKFCPMPEVSVAAGGRVFRAFGHIAHRSNQNALLNTLIGVNGYNGTILWQRPLHEGFMIHRNTMIATPDVLYLGDDESCKLIDARTGRLKDQIVVPVGAADGPVWKWMALAHGTLYALVGSEEIKPQTQRSDAPGMGHWPWAMWQGHDYEDPKTNFGFGRTFLAIDPIAKKILWAYRQQDFVDARGVAMENGHIYFYSPGKFLGCLNAASGQVVWKNSDRDLLEAIGRDGPAQLWITGYATATFLKCNDRYIFFAGPQRSRLVAASTKDGKLVWDKEPGNLQLVLRDDSIYCAGAEKTCGFRLAYDTGEQLGLLPARRACTRATGTVDSVFFRATGGTVRIDTASGVAKHIAPMRPPCQDGVIVSDGLLYWGPWMCGCQLSLYGHICLGPAGDFNFRPELGGSRLVTVAKDLSAVVPFPTQPRDWPTYLGDNARNGQTEVRLPDRPARRWTYRIPGSLRPTAPIIAGGCVFIGDAGGTLRALDAGDGSVRWQAHTGGAMFFPPALWQGRLYAGSADGRVYAFEAATGRLLWRFRAAPADRWIPVYGKLLSTWPVAGGVVVADGVVYVAAGIAHYDGTYVYALDAASGRVKWCNDSSGSLSEKVDCGISLQGHLYLANGELRFLGGGAYETARYDLSTGKCLNQPDDSVASRFRTAFYPYYPDYGRYMSLAHRMSDGRELIYDASYEGSQHRPLALLAPLPPGVSRPFKEEARWPVHQPREPNRAVLWTDRSGSRFNALVLAPGALLVAGHTGMGPSEEPFLATINTVNGADIWRAALPAASVKGGAAVDSQGRIIVGLENGIVLALAGP